MGGYLDVKVCVFQVQRTEPVLCANLWEDLLQRDHPERPSHEGVIQASEIEDGPEAATAEIYSRLRGVTAGAGFAGCWVGAVLGRLWAAAGLERLGRKCRIACDALLCFCEALSESFHRRSKEATGKIGASRKETLSASLISVSVSHRWRSSTTRLAIDLPMAWAVSLGGSQS